MVILLYMAEMPTPDLLVSVNNKKFNPLNPFILKRYRFKLCLAFFMLEQVRRI